MKRYADNKSKKNKRYKHLDKISSSPKKAASEDIEFSVEQPGRRYSSDLEINSSSGKPGRRYAKDETPGVNPASKYNITNTANKRRIFEDISSNSVPQKNIKFFPREKSTWIKCMPAIVFSVFIFVMTIWFVFAPKTDYSSSEKRYLQKFPDASVENISSGQFGDEFENFFADHFPSRNFWVGFNSYYSLGIGNNGAGGVYNCKDGYLINKPVSKDNNIDKNTNAIVDFKNTIDVPITVMLVPSTGYIAEDMLPLIHDKYNDDEYFDGISKKLADNGISFVDLREAFKNEYAGGNQLYYKTDHHWTTYGAFTAYQRLCEQLGVSAVEKNRFTVETYGDFYGTAYSTSGFWFTKPDTIEVWRNPENSEQNIGVTITEGTKQEKYNSMYFYDHIEEDDKYPVFIDGNHALTEITNSKAEGGTIVVIKDSFCHSLAPFLAENFSKVILVDMRYYKQDVSAIINSKMPEQIAVIYGIDNFATDTDIVWLK